MRILFAFMFTVVSSMLFSQKKVYGVVSDEKNIPIPFAKIYAKNAADLRTIADEDGYYELMLFPGEYFLVYSAMGYEDRDAYVAVSDQETERNMQLFPTKIQDISDVSVSVKRTNPGRDIMMKVVERRDTINPWNYPHQVEVYTKTSEQIESTGKSKKKKTKNDAPQDIIEDPFLMEQKALDSLANHMNLLEIQLNRSYAPPGKVKEVKNAYELRGSDKYMYYTTTVKSNFNFFQNLIHLDDLHQTPVSSPISTPGILSYKYRLEDQYEEGGVKIHKIKILPRNIATTTLEGYIYVYDSIWMVQKLELSMQKGNLLTYDYFNIEQKYANVGDTLNLLTEQTLSYGVKFKDEKRDLKTISAYTSYEFNPNFKKKYFSNELASMNQEAYDKDSTFWANQRKTELTPEEIKFIITKDSIHDAHNRKEYLDSIDRVFNKITALKVLWFGVEHRNRAKKNQWTISSIAGMSRPLYIAGPRVAPSLFYFKKWENEQALDTYTEISYGFLNKDIKGNTWWRFRYDPFHFGTATFQFSQDFGVIRSYDAITQIYKRSNFIEKTELDLGHDYEIFNGFYLNNNFKFSERRTLEGYQFLTLFDKDIPNDDPSDFQTYQALILDATISYTPGQKYVREPKRKVVLGSKWPTFYVTYERGIPKLFGSDIDHEYGRVGIMQTFKIGTLGTTSYHVLSGKFLSSRNLKEADFKFQRRSDPIWFSNPLYSFQGLDSSLPSKQIFYEGHIVHHDNGALLNKIPFMKKTGLGLVFGLGGLYVKEFDWQHYEFLMGLERNIKFSKRRLRLGVYWVVSDGNHIKTKSTWKISIAILDDRNMKWNF